MVTKSRLAEYDSLSTAEKILRLQDLWDEISNEPDAVPVTDAQTAELDDRLEELRNDPTRGSTWPEARARIRKSKR